MTKLDDLIRDALEFEPDADVSSISYAATPEWDSVAHMRLLAALEEEYELTLEPEELMAMTDYASVRMVIEGRTGAERS